MMHRLFFIKPVLFVAFAFIGGLQMGFSQTPKTVAGIVNDANGMPLPGATVVVKGTSTGATTDFDGNFSFQVPGSAQALQISYVGFKTQDVPITDGTITVSMEQQDNQLDEVVVVGYGSIKRSDVVGAVSSIDVEDATVTPTTNVAEMLRGRAAGVQVNLSDPRPGGNSNIVIRGNVSVNAGNDPLIIVDGVPYDDINDVAPEDITSIEVLKDASSQAIYGSRAANGVILITTKRGKEGKFQVNYHGYTTVQKLTKNFDLFSATEFAQLRREANRTSNGGEYLEDETIFEPFELDAIANQNYVDWEDLVLRQALIQSHSITASGGGERTKAFTSLNYFKQDGLIPTSGFDRGTFRMNIDQKISDKVSLQANVNLQTSTQDRESTSLNFINISPLAKPYDENGELVKFPLGDGNLTVNPLWNIREADREVKTTLTDLNLVGKYDFTDNLSYKLNVFSRSRHVQDNQYRTSKHSEADDRNGSAELRTTEYREFLIENILDYNLDINKDNNLAFTLVQSVNQRKTITNFLEKSNFANDRNGFNGDAEVLRQADREVLRRRLVSGLARVRYNLKNRYLLTLTARADGSTVFAPDEKYGFFPAAAIAWKVDQEEFLKNSQTINQLKFRASYGATGNEGINLKEAIGVAEFIPYVFRDPETGVVTTSSGFAPPTRLPNPNLKWETTKTFNVGVDFGLFKNRVQGSVEYYSSSTTDLLLDRIISGTSGFERTRFNIGEVTNKGLEVTLNGDVIRNQELRWSIGATYSQNKNEVVSLAGGRDADGNLLDFPEEGLFIGEPINNIRQYVFDGIFQSQAEIDASAQAEENPDNGPIVGDVRVRDLNGDGVIDANNDRKIFKVDPDWYGSLNTTFQYKGFELFADLYFLEGAKRLNGYLADEGLGGSLQSRVNGIKRDYYTPENPSSTVIRPRREFPPFLFSQAVQDASYIRLRTVTLGYNLPGQFLDRLGITNAKVYATATNLFTITDYLSWSPEVNPGDFPDTKGFTVGFKLGL